VDLNFSKVSRLVPRPIWPPNQSIPMVLSGGLKCPEHAVDCSHLSRAKFMKSGAIPPLSTCNFTVSTWTLPTYVCCTISVIHDCGHKLLYHLIPDNGIDEKLTVAQAVTKISYLSHNQKFQSYLHRRPRSPKADESTSHPQILFI
jgi:hypothetical protein